MAKASKKAADNAASENGNEATTGHFTEWECKITRDPETKKPSAEKLKVVRRVVKITEQEAETLNEGVLNGNNTYGKLYFPAE